MIVIAEHGAGQFVKTERLNELTPEHNVLCRTLSNVGVGEIVDRMNIIDGLKTNISSIVSRASRWTYFELLAKLMELLARLLMH